MEQLNRLYDNTILKRDKEITDTINKFISKLDSLWKDQNVETDLFKMNLQEHDNSIKDAPALNSMQWSMEQNNRKNPHQVLPSFEKPTHKRAFAASNAVTPLESLRNKVNDTPDLPPLDNRKPRHTPSKSKILDFLIYCYSR